MTREEFYAMPCIADCFPLTFESGKQRWSLPFQRQPHAVGHRLRGVGVAREMKYSGIAGLFAHTERKSCACVHADAS